MVAPSYPFRAMTRRSPSTISSRRRSVFGGRPTKLVIQPNNSGHTAGCQARGDGEIALDRPFDPPIIILLKPVLPGSSMVERAAVDGAGGKPAQVAASA